jgi:hypothetical protein
MRHMRHIIACTLALLGLWWPGRADVEIEVTPPVAVTVDSAAQPKAPPPVKRGLAIAFQSAAPGHLFTPDQPIALTAVVTSPGQAISATLRIRVCSALGCLVYSEARPVHLPAAGAASFPVVVPASLRLPHGPYRVEVWGEAAAAIGYGATWAHIWPGPATRASSGFGISYQGPLDTAHTWLDLDLFRQAGIRWVRFPLQGWLPQGQAVPPAAEVYNTFIQEAGRRDFSLVAAFTPRTTVDPAINAAQAEKEYHESLLAAAARYGFKVKWWELMRVKPDPAFPDLKGIGYTQLAKGREALRHFDKSLRTLFSIEDPYKWNAMELYHQGLPAEGDVLGLLYNFIGLPETKANPTPPLYALEEVVTGAPGYPKRKPEIWVSEYGFDPTKRDRLPAPVYQAALLGRALILNRVVSISRTFWRHDPTSQYDLPFIDAEGSALPSLPGLRTTLEMLEGASSVEEIASPLNLKTFLLRYGDEKGKKKRGKVKPRFVLVAWSERGPWGISDPAGLALKTTATQLAVTDFWGNTLELKPTGGTAVVSVDEFPRFIDLGADEKVELFAPFIRFSPPRLVLRDGQPNRMVVEMVNDQRLFSGQVVCNLTFRRWPNLEGEKIITKDQKIVLDPYGHQTLTTELTVPDNASKGQIFQVSLDIAIGTRRVGFLILPVWYLPGGETDLREPPRAP